MNSGLHSNKEQINLDSSYLAYIVSYPKHGFIAFNQTFGSYLMLQKLKLILLEQIFPSFIRLYFVALNA